MELYLDLFVLENTVLNLFVMMLTSKLSNIHPSFLRKLSGALVGTLFAVLLVLYNRDLLQSFGVKLVISSLLVLIVYFPKTLRDFLRTFSIFCLSAMVVAGTMFFLLTSSYGNMILFNKSYRISSDFNFSIFSLTLLLCWAFISVLYKLKKSKELKEEYVVDLYICIDQQKASLPALIDTGNLLCDPLTNLPVIIAEYIALKEILPKEISRFLESEKTLELFKISDVLHRTSWLKRLRIIPFKSLGNEKDLIIGFRPDQVEIGSNKKIVKNVIIGIYTKSLSKDREFQAILGPQILS
jgi:stage II sporulation protein GA (sporulation sigma-E factor processing peptidase)